VGAHEGHAAGRRLVDERHGALAPREGGFLNQFADSGRRNYFHPVRSAGAPARDAPTASYR
jgi:hypothetical protein